MLDVYSPDVDEEVPVYGQPPALYAIRRSLLVPDITRVH